MLKLHEYLHQYLTVRRGMRDRGGFVIRVKPRSDIGSGALRRMPSTSPEYHSQHLWAWLHFRQTGTSFWKTLERRRTKTYLPSGASADSSHSQILTSLGRHESHENLKMHNFWSGQTSQEISGRRSLNSCHEFRQLRMNIVNFLWNFQTERAQIWLPVLALGPV